MMKEHFHSIDKSTLRGYNILFQSLPKHDGPYTSTPWQLATKLAESNRVIFVDHPYSILDLITGFFKPSIFRRIKAMFGSIGYKKDGVEVIHTPFVFPVNFLPK